MEVQEGMRALDGNTYYGMVTVGECRRTLSSADLAEAERLGGPGLQRIGGDRQPIVAGTPLLSMYVRNSLL